MKKLAIITTAIISAFAVAANIGISGSVKNSSATAQLRVGAFIVDRNGKPGQELGSSQPANGLFTLSVPETAPAASTITQLSSENLDWPGLIGAVRIQGAAKAARASLRGYIDADKNGSFSAGDTVLETSLTRGRGNLVLIYAADKFRVQGDRGFDVSLEAGWNLISIELGKTVSAKRVANLDGVQLEVFNK
jgi:hypothetical protein